MLERISENKKGSNGRLVINLDPDDDASGYTEYGNIVPTK